MKIILILALFLSSIGIQAQEADTHGVSLPDADELHITVSEDKLPLGTKDCYMRIVLDRTIKADELFGNKVKLVTEVDEIKCKNPAISPLLKMAMSSPKSHSDYGIYFYAYVVDGIFRNMADALE